MGPCTVLRTFSVWSPWEVNAQEEMEVTGVKWPAQGCTASARQSRDWNPGVSYSAVTFLTPTKCSHPAAVAASWGLSNRWFLLWSYFCFHFLSAIALGNPERELACHSQNKTWDLCRVGHLFPARGCRQCHKQGKLSPETASDGLPTYGTRLRSQRAWCLDAVSLLVDRFCFVLLCFHLISGSPSTLTAFSLE